MNARKTWKQEKGGEQAKALHCSWNLNKIQTLAAGIGLCITLLYESKGRKLYQWRSWAKIRNIWGCFFWSQYDFIPFKLNLAFIGWKTNRNWCNWSWLQIGNIMSFPLPAFLIGTRQGPSSFQMLIHLSFLILLSSFSNCKNVLIERKILKQKHLKDVQRQ